jgi:hypothetical protein
LRCDLAILLREIEVDKVAAGLGSDRGHGAGSGEWVEDDVAFVAVGRLLLIVIPSLSRNLGMAIVSPARRQWYERKQKFEATME